MKTQRISALLLACVLLTVPFFSCSGGSTDAPMASASSVHMEGDSTGYAFDSDILQNVRFDGYDFSEMRNLAQMTEEYETEGYEDDEYYEDEEAEYEYEEDGEEDYADDESEYIEWEEDEE